MNSLRFACRQLMLRPGFSIIAILTLALTVGAATMVFSIFDAVLLRPFPYPNADELVRVQTVLDGDTGEWKGVSLFDFEDFRRRQQSFQHLAAHATFPNQLTGRGSARAIRMTFASSGFFETLQVAPRIGRVFRVEEDVFGGPVRKVVLSHAMWQDLFQGSDTALGQTVQLRGEAYEVIGVMPSGFDYPNRSQVWVPLMARYSAIKDDWWKRRDTRAHLVLGRLAPGKSIEQAQADLEGIARQLRQEHPDSNRGAGADVITMRQAEVGQVAPYVRLTAAAVGLLLLLGCVNLANLFIARGAGRVREVALRLALGSGTWQLLQQLIVESFLYSSIGSVLGLLFAYLGVMAFKELLPSEVPAWMSITIDGRVVLFAVLAAAGASLVAAVLPALQQMKTNAAEVLKQGSRGSSGGSAYSLMVRRALIVSEIAVSVVLLAGAVLLVRSFDRLMDVDTGVKFDNVVVTRASRFVPGVSGEIADREYNGVYRKLQQALSALPGVEMASGGSAVPFVEQAEQRGASEIFTRRRATRDQAIREPFIGADVMPGYFAVLGIPLIEGRDFNELDTKEKDGVVVIGKRTAERLFPGERALGQKLRWGNNQGFDPWMTVIGVVGDTRFSPAEAKAGLEVYWSYRQYPGPGMYMLVKTRGESAAFTPLIRQTIQTTAPDVAMESVKLLKEALSEHVWRRRLWSLVLTGFAGLALCIALVGLYGVLSFLVAQRTRELGIRLAIGARPSAILRLVLWAAAQLVLPGAVLGIVIALLASRWLNSVVFGISTYDPSSYILVSMLMIVMAFIATLIPAWRAARLDPLIALREE